MKIINKNLSGDYHIHSATFSDGFNSIDDIVLQAGKLKLKEIAITDHCQAYLNSFSIPKKTHYSILTSGRWQNIHNDVHVIFGVEADLLDETGAVCDEIQGISPDFTILSAHREVYCGDASQVKNGYINAIKRYGSKIKCLGHLCSLYFSEYLGADDIADIVHLASAAGIAVELNCANIVNHKTCEANLRAMLSCCDSLYVNSDAHTLHELIHLRSVGFTYLKNLNIF